MNQSNNKGVVFRHIRKVNNEFYESSEELVECVLKVLKRTQKNKKGTCLFVDPCVGRGAIFRRLPKPKVGFDISPKYLSRGHQYTVKDFLSVSQLKAPPEHTIIVGNPPFCAKNGESQVINFLNHGISIANTIIFIVPLNLNKIGPIRKVKNARLTDIFFLPKACMKFIDSKSNSKTIVVCVQVWQKLADDPSKTSWSQKLHVSDKISNRDFRIYSDPGAVLSRKLPYFFIYRIGLLYKIGRLSSKPPFIRSDNKYSNTWYAVQVLDPSKYNSIKSKFEKLHDQKLYETFLAGTSSYNYYQITIEEIVDIYYGNQNRLKIKKHFW